MFLPYRYAAALRVLPKSREMVFPIRANDREITRKCWPSTIGEQQSKERSVAPFYIICLGISWSWLTWSHQVLSCLALFQLSRSGRTQGRRNSHDAGLTCWSFSLSHSCRSQPASRAYCLHPSHELRCFQRHTDIMSLIHCCVSFQQPKEGSNTVGKTARKE